MTDWWTAEAENIKLVNEFADLLDFTALNAPHHRTRTAALFSLAYASRGIPVVVLASTATNLGYLRDTIASYRVHLRTKDVDFDSVAIASMYSESKSCLQDFLELWTSAIVYDHSVGGQYESHYHDLPVVSGG